MTRSERNRRRRKIEKRVRAVAFLVLFAAVLSVGLGVRHVYAKYFSESARWGVAIASGVYFTANYATANEDFFETVVKNDYTGNKYDFVFEVRNYENQLLFNESGVVIPYSVSFWLGESPVNAQYQVECQEQFYTIGVEEDGKVTIDGQTIGGGSAFANEYQIHIIADSSEESHKAVPIYVEVQTAEGAIINRTLRGKMVLNNQAAPENYIESQEFIVPEDVTDDAEKFARILKMSEFTYEIRTVGEVASDDVTERLKLSWNPKLLEIDLFDEAYLAWQEDVEESSGARPEQPAKDESGWYYITLEVMPYSAQSVHFLRGADFETSVKNMDVLNEAIKAEKENGQ